jgi:hypothetical protein
VSEQHKVHGHNLSTYGIDDFVALEHRLLSLPYEGELNELSKCLRVALLLYSNLAHWKTPLYFGWIQPLAAKLKTALIDLDWQSKNHGLEVRQPLMWMFFLGGQATRDQDVIDAAWWTLRLRLIIQDRVERLAGGCRSTGGLLLCEESKWEVVGTHVEYRHHLRRSTGANRSFENEASMHLSEPKSPMGIIEFDVDFHD